MTGWLVSESHRQGKAGKAGKAGFLQPSSCGRAKAQGSGLWPRTEKGVWAGTEMRSCRPALTPPYKQQEDRQGAARTGSRLGHNYLRAGRDFQGEEATDSLLWRDLYRLVTVSCRVTPKQRWTAPGKWEVTGFVQSHALTDASERCTSFSYSVSEEQDNRNLSRLELSPLRQNKEKRYG